MVWYPSVREVFETHCKPQDSLETRNAGARKFVEHFRRDLGLTTNEEGRPTVKIPDVNYRTFSLKQLAETLIGHNWSEVIQAATARDHNVFEAGDGAAAAMVPGHIPNVSAYLGSVSGLLDAALIEGYDQPEYVIDSLIPMETSKVRQKKLIGHGRIGDQSKKRNPGQAHPFAQFEERYSTTPETTNDALALGVTFEMVFFDQTGEALDQANQVGNELGLRKELDGFAVLSGNTNPYNYRGIAYNTYLTSGNWINDQVLLLEDWTSINTVNALFSRMTDQEASQPVAVNWDTIVCSPAKEMSAKYIEGATEIETQTQSGTQVRRGARLGEKYKIVSSIHLNKYLVDTEGLSQTAADGRWWCLRTDGSRAAFYRIENWPFAISRAAPNDFTMLNHKLMLAVFADQMHAFGVREPRYAIRNKIA